MTENDDRSELEKAVKKERAIKSFRQLAAKGPDRGNVVHGRHQGKINAAKVLEWVWQWGWTYEQVLQQLLNVERRPGADFCKRGLLRRVEPPRGFYPTYVIHADQISRAGEIYDENLIDQRRPNISNKQPIQLEYDYPEKKSIPYKTLGEHDRVAQLLAINALSKQSPADQKASPWQLTTWRELDVGKAGAVPDFVISRNIGKEIIEEWHEVELTGKHLGAEITQQIHARHVALEQGRFQRIVWHCRTNRIALNLMIELEKKRLRQTQRGLSGKFAFDETKPYWDPRKLLAASTFMLINGPGTLSEKCAVRTGKPIQGDLPLDVVEGL